MNWKGQWAGCSETNLTYLLLILDFFGSQFFFALIFERIFFTRILLDLLKKKLRSNWRLFHFSHCMFTAVPHNPHAKCRTHRRRNRCHLSSTAFHNFPGATDHRYLISVVTEDNFFFNLNYVSRRKGFFVDKFGKYKPVVILTLLLNAVFHHALFMIPQQEIPGVSFKCLNKRFCNAFAIIESDLNGTPWIS